MKQLVLAEKPSVARDLSNVLGNFNKGNGYLESDAYIITWAIGHLVTLAEPDDYDAALKKWFLNTLPILPREFKLKPVSATLKQFNIVKSLLHRNDVGDIICATDSGREGELIFRYIYKLTDCQKPFKRLWLSETTPAAVRKGFDNLRPGNDLDRLAFAAEARSQADWLIGINATRAFTVKHNQLLSVGRVQTPTLALIVNREQEIRAFVPEKYWELFALFTKENGQTYIGKWFKKEKKAVENWEIPIQVGQKQTNQNPAASFEAAQGGIPSVMGEAVPSSNGQDKPVAMQTKFAAREAARDIQKKVTGQPGQVVSVEKKDIIEHPPLLFNLNDLQKEANKKFGLSAAKTLSVAQELYESRKLITYPRTDSRCITVEMGKTIPQRLGALAVVAEYENFIHLIKERKAFLNKRYINDSKVTDHTALIPTNVKPDLDKLSSDERRVYDLVVRRFLAAFFPPARYEQTQVITEVKQETFLSRGRVELDKGWKTVYDPVQDKLVDDEQGILPVIENEESVLTTKTDIKEKKTNPPKRYTEAALLSVMEGAGRLLNDEELKEAMRGSGLGTPATRAAIIERLLKVGYIERRKKTLLPTEKGENLIKLVPEQVKSPEMTARWEKALADIEDGQLNPGEFMSGIIEQTRQVVELARRQKTEGEPLRNNRDIIGKCPLCGRPVVEYPKSYSCSDYRAGCQFVIWKVILGKNITVEMARILLEKGRLEKQPGFISKNGKKFDAPLIIRNGRVEFDF
ncbi:DNA topoisomerase III [Desulfofarcimen acetoxidans DSM 771]|uniref:DNA topoisomerase n=1 Tax=Desulfofarcimen acetoxidans (strain ATCC 49208 / DSM 771 / KCTC 5769 / VKM B-1644 / 5575) TaxID=485916 RepID=C8VXL1_DESAS|nr:DNA topoisomerase III [Desulfofarcimen acetoxidans]ACV62667.1 DNA topoisomerase III [Desulfofarcimen acetoxidans DSM 771]